MPDEAAAAAAAEEKKRRTKERLAYAAACFAAAGGGVTADVFFTRDVIKKRMWRRRRRVASASVGSPRPRGGRHMVLAFSLTLKVFTLVALLLGFASLIAAYFPDFKLMGMSVVQEASSGDGDRSFLDEFLPMSLAILKPCALLVLGVWTSAAVFDVRDVLLHVGYDAAAKLNVGPKRTRGGAFEPPWVRFMAMHGLVGLLVSVFTFVVLLPGPDDSDTGSGTCSDAATASPGKVWDTIILAD